MSRLSWLLQAVIVIDFVNCEINSIFLFGIVGRGNEIKLVLSFEQQSSEPIIRRPPWRSG